MSEVSFTRDFPMPPDQDGPAVPFDQPPQFSNTPYDRDRPPVTDGIPRFFTKAVRTGDGAYVNVEMVEILTPGDNKATPVHKVTDRLRQQYAWHYSRWRKGLEISHDGVPLEMFPVLDTAQVQMLKALNIFTVEDLCGVPDSSLHRIPMGITLRQSAKTWMESKKETDAIDRQSRENETLKSGMRMLEQQMQEMAQRLAAAEAQKVEPAQPALVAQPLQMPAGLSDAISQAADNAEPKRGPGRPKKEG